MVEGMRRLECTHCSSAVTRSMVVCTYFVVVPAPCAVASSAPGSTIHSAVARMQPPVAAGPDSNRKRRM